MADNRSINVEQSFAMSSIAPAEGQSSEWPESVPKVPYHLNIQRDKRNKRKNLADAKKSLYINIKQSNLNKDSQGLLKKAQ